MHYLTTFPRKRTLLPDDDVVQVPRFAFRPVHYLTLLYYFTLAQ